jgi:GTP-binding protein
LGDKFLRHILRTRVLVHVLDASQLDGNDPLAAWKAINREMELFDPELIDKPQIVVANKIDLPDGRELAKVLGKKLPKAYRPLQVISAATTEGVQQLVYTIGRKLDEVRRQSETEGDAARA